MYILGIDPGMQNLGWAIGKIINENSNNILYIKVINSLHYNLNMPDILINFLCNKNNYLHKHAAYINQNTNYKFLLHQKYNYFYKECISLLIKNAISALSQSESSLNERKTVKALACGLIKNNNKLTFIEKLTFISNELQKIINNYNPEIVGIETTFMHKGIKANMNFAKIYGAILEILRKNGLKILEFSPTQIKKTITQNGKASKIQIATMIKFLLPNADCKTEHESDAFAALYTAFVSII